ncbi:MAG TPA: hypothetical protein PKN04_04825 [bacterium]|jgi:hypothetical protein|nr:hypothetical protein [bacterium]HNT65085.1 hypothetical protein [bacterium]
MEFRRMTLNWLGEDIAYLRIDRRRSLVPLVVGLVFFAFWYGSILSSFDLTTGPTIWQSIWQVLKEGPPIIILLLAPLIPIVAMARQTFVGSRLIFNKKVRAVFQNKHRLLEFDDVQAVLIQLHPQKTARVGADLLLQSKTGKPILLARCDSYESCAALAQEIAVIVHAEVKTQQLQG